jgi:hypothetical protein
MAKGAQQAVLVYAEERDSSVPILWRFYVVIL